MCYLKAKDSVKFVSKNDAVSTLTTLTSSVLLDTMADWIYWYKCWNN